MRKKRICILLGICVLLLAGVLARYEIKHRFTTEKWLEQPEQRREIVDDFLKRYALEGRTKEEVIALLGEGEVYDDRLMYFLGMERGLISIDTEWMVISFVDDIVTQIDFVTD